MSAEQHNRQPEQHKRHPEQSAQPSPRAKRTTVILSEAHNRHPEHRPSSS